LLPQRYERKSISYLDALYLATPQAREVDRRYVGEILRQVKGQVEIPRFDFNPLPEALVHNFVETANARGSLTVDDIASLMQERLVPPIIALLEGAMESRAGELVSEEKRQLFLATKAKELGITLEEIEKVMNSAYIYLPVLTGWSLKKEKDSDRWTCKMQGGIVWFQIVQSDDQPRVILRKRGATESMGFGSQDFAVESAALNFGRNLGQITRDMPEFKLGAPVVEVEGRSVRFPLGRRDGVGLDEVYWVGEWVVRGEAEPDFAKDGWTRVTSVGDNRNDPVALSTGLGIRRGDWAPGMMVVEHPRLGIDVAVKTGAYKFRTSDGYIPVLGDYLHVKEPFDGLTFGLDLDAQINISGLTGGVGSFLIVGGHFLFPPAEYEGGSLFADLTTSPPLVWGLQAGYMKRYYVGQMALAWEAKAAGRWYSVEQEFRAFGTDYKLTVANNTIGVEGAVNLEWASSPDLNYGLRLGYRLYPESDVWTVDLKPGDWSGVADPDYPFPVVDHSGVMVGLYLHWSPPQLPFDPAGLIQGALGK